MIARMLGHAFFLAGLTWLFATAAPSAELVLFESAECSWCEAWNTEIGNIYPKAPEGRIAPLRRVDIHRERPADLRNLRGIIYTPTFVLMEDGREVGRITGYAGEDFFWGLLGIELKKLNRTAEPAPELSASSEAPVDAKGEQK